MLDAARVVRRVEGGVAVSVPLPAIYCKDTRLGIKQEAIELDGQRWYSCRTRTPSRQRAKSCTPAYPEALQPSCSCTSQAFRPP